MSQNDPGLIERQSAAYLDGLMGDAERQRFEQLLQSQPELLRQADAQAQIDASLRRQFPVQPPDDQDIAALMTAANLPQSEVHIASEVAPTRKGGRRLMWLALATAVAWAFVAWQFWDRAPTTRG